MQINPDTLKKLRNKAGLSQQALADASGLTKRSIARFESGNKNGGEPRGYTLNRIAKALGVKLEVLAQEPESEAVREEEEEVRKKYGWGVLNYKHRFDGESVISYDLIQDRYGVGMYDLIKFAPLLFTILAEQSLANRRRRLEEMKKNYEDFPTYLIFGADYDLGLSIEEFSLKKRDLFGQKIADTDDAFSSGAIASYFLEEARNPFNDFLIEQAKSLGPDNDAIDPEEIHNLGNFDNLPSFNLFESFRKKLTGGSSRADYALSRGYTRIGQIPKELRGEDEDVTADRVKWLESKVPDEDWDEYEELMDSLVL